MRSIFLVTGFFILLLANSSAQQTIGLFLDTEESYDGYTLFPTTSDEVYLINNCGQLIQKWQVGNKGYGPAMILKNGDLLKATRADNPQFFAGGGQGILERYDWDNELLWTVEYHDELKLFHHDMCVLPNGNIIFLAWERKTPEECMAVGTVGDLPSGLWTETIIEIKPTDNNGYDIVWRWDVWDHLIQDANDTLPNYGVISQNPNRFNVNMFTNLTAPDWLHFNSIDYNADLDQIIVSSRSLSEIFIIDHSTSPEEAASQNGGNAGRGGDILWRWGNPANYDQGTEIDQQLFGQHNAHWIKPGHPGEGHILVFNNGGGIPEDDFYSTVVELSPDLSEFNYLLSEGKFLPLAPFWEFKDTPPTSFYGQRISSTQRLPNGNTLINEGTKGRFFEVDMDGNKLWEYVNPVGLFGPVSQFENPNGIGVFSINKYDRDYSGFDNKDMGATDPIEINPLNIQCLTVSTTTPAYDHQFTITNPVINDLHIFTSSKENYQLEIYTMQGALISASTWKGNVSIAFSHLISGSYIIRINDHVKMIQKL